ncbi:hypothetical protein ACJZ2D_014648 [Fusarium nematophilum]
MVNRWNKAMAVGLRHNHDISFIATQCRGPGVEKGGRGGRTAPRPGRFLMRVANRIFTDRPLSQVEVVAYLLGYPTEFASNHGWTFLNASSLYWHIFRWWRHLRRQSGMEMVDEQVEETGLSLYDYMSVVKLKRKSKGVGAWGEVQFDSSWPYSQTWVQALRKPGEHAVVCFDGYLSTDFSDEGEVYYKRGMSHRLLLTATSGTAAASIDGITIHSACGFSKDTAARSRRAEPDGFAAPSSVSLRIDGQTTAEWQEKWLLIVDELRGSARDFGRIPVVLFCGDFHQFRPVQERSILLPSTTIAWDEERSFTAEQRYQNRWNLNIEASLCFQKERRAPLRIFISEHRWKDGEPSEEEAVMILNQGDDSAIPVPAVLMFVPGMPVVVN